MRCRRRYIWATLVILLLGMVPAQAGDGEGGLAGEFLRYGVSARSFGLGRAGLALSDDASAIFNNPAALLRLPTRVSLYTLNEFGSTFPYYQGDFSNGGFNFFAVGMNRPAKTGFSYGPTSAWGFSALISNDGGYEYRDGNDQLLANDQFAFSQYAFNLALAREIWIKDKSWFVLDLGANIKYVGQSVSGISALEATDSDFGIDFGAHLQLLNPPLLKEVFSLRDLLPFRLAMVFQNIKAPSVGYGGAADDFPRSFRIGGAYDFGQRYGWDQWGLVTVIDVEKVGSRSTSFYFGAEPTWRTDDVALALRGGVSLVSGESQFSLGCGLSTRVLGLDVRFDFAQGFHERLPDDQRVSIAIGLGGRRDAAHFADPKVELSPLPRDLLIVSQYDERTRRASAGATLADPGYDSDEGASPPGPNRYYPIAEAAKDLAYDLDPDNKARYEFMFSDCRKADTIFASAWREFLSGGDASELALAAIEQFESAFKAGDDCGHLDYATALMIAYRGDSDPRRYEQALAEIRTEVKTSIRSRYLEGVCLERLGQFAAAAQAYSAGAKLRPATDAESTMVLLSQFGAGRTRFKDSDWAAGSQALREVNNGRYLSGHGAPLPDSYPRFHQFDDNDLADDALYLLGHCLNNLQQGPEAARTWASICRYYPDLDYCRDEDRRQEYEKELDSNLNRSE